MTSYSQENTILALLRTEMANNRTFMSYIRTSIIIFATGLGLLKYLKAGVIYEIIGGSLMPIAALVFILGLREFYKTKKIILMEKKKEEAL